MKIKAKHALMALALSLLAHPEWLHAEQKVTLYCRIGFNAADEAKGQKRCAEYSKSFVDFFEGTAYCADPEWTKGNEVELNEKQEKRLTKAKSDLAAANTKQPYDRPDVVAAEGRLHIAKLKVAEELCRQRGLITESLENPTPYCNPNFGKTCYFTE